MLTCKSKGTRNGMLPLPSRANRLPSSPIRSDGCANSRGENSGCGTRAACSQ